jgi:hypothetical protein
MDVSGDRDFALDFLYAASTTMLHLSRLAEDWILYSSEEFGWLELGDVVTSGSSLMPQKKNPDSLELIRGKSGRVFASLSSLFVTMKGLPMTYNRDMQEDKEPLFDAADQLCGSLEMAAVVVESAKLHPEHPPRRRKQLVVATDLAEVWRATGRRSIRRIRRRPVGAGECSRAGRPDWPAAELQSSPGVHAGDGGIPQNLQKAEDSGPRRQRTEGSGAALNQPRTVWPHYENEQSYAG